jgi:lincosamide nucleotidyltransferase A/C/D/E
VKILNVKKFNIPVFAGKTPSERSAPVRQAVALVRRGLRSAYKLAGSPRSPLSPLLRLPAIEKARQRLNEGEVSAADVVEMLACLRDAGVRAWLVGGWATDALLGQQTRAHEDVDLAIEASGEATARAALERAGFHVTHEAPAGRWLSVHVKMIDGLRRPVALHPVDVDAWSAPAGPGSIRQGARELGMGEIDEVFATGRLAGHDVPATSAAAQMVLRCGYEIREFDRRDVEALCRRFRLPAPLPYLDAATGASAGAAGGGHR